ncbi:hypothetical protein NL154_14450 [Rhizobium sp. YTUHZ044]|uniref:hypothetical protein n=1 Tax=Rhizobium sp. YTUHZ044 TaxID=2962678 RepID=UPI003DAA35DF
MAPSSALRPLLPAGERGKPRPSPRVSSPQWGEGAGRRTRGPLALNVDFPYRVKSSICRSDRRGDLHGELAEGGFGGGAGINTNIVAASLEAIVSAANRVLEVKAGKA